jgi:hypothetical protein
MKPMLRFVAVALEMAKLALLGMAATLIFNCGQQLTLAYLCPPYFYEGLYDYFHTTNPLTLGLGWGVIGSWWVGLPLSVIFALVATVGAWPRLFARRALPLVAFLVLGLWLASLVIGATGYFVARAHTQGAEVFLARWLPLGWEFYLSDPETWWRFSAASWADTAAYYTGAAGALLLCGVALVLRWRASRAMKQVDAPSAIAEPHVG